MRLELIQDRILKEELGSMRHLAMNLSSSRKKVSESVFGYKLKFNMQRILEVLQSIKILPINEKLQNCCSFLAINEVLMHLSAWNVLWIMNFQTREISSGQPGHR